MTGRLWSDCATPSLRGSLSIALVVALGSLLSQAVADEIIYNPVTHSQLQAVLDGSNGTTAGDSYWTSIHPTLTPYPVSFLGVVVNNPTDMLSGADEWQVFVQALPAGTYGGYTVAAGDFGGTALYMTRALPWNGTILYDEAAWPEALGPLNYPVGSSAGAPLREGDVVLVQAKAPGLFYKGKFNINEQHSNDPAKDFGITILERDFSLDSLVQTIDLADLKTSDNSGFLFDATRETGCESYQGSLVHLNGLTLVDINNWALNGTVVVSQGNLTFNMKLGLDTGLLDFDAAWFESNPLFSVTAILDQESSNPTAGYRLWLTNAANLTPTTVPEPSSLALLAMAGLTAWCVWRRRASS